ncbi:hypothetical protein [Asaia bogorensis]|uniref:hypothetical protein n=1 Tax=Asaia bogorensis TaxID=91915 RepID=UPI000EFB7526|nr:hypothetical protein [Asaia bogorensis]
MNSASIIALSAIAAAILGFGVYVIHLARGAQATKEAKEDARDTEQAANTQHAMDAAQIQVQADPDALERSLQDGTF